MISQLIISLRAFVVLTILTCILYPLAVTGLAKICFPRQAGGSIISHEGKPCGSELIAQKFSEPGYFWSRPSAVDYGTVASGASNQGFASQKLLDSVAERKLLYGTVAAPDLLYASGSGLDPHISPDAAACQVARVAAARHLSVKKLSELVNQFTEAPQYGFLGQKRINVLLLNLALDGLK